MRSVPYERYKWMAIAFPEPSPMERYSFEMMIYGLITSGVSTVIVNGPRGPIVVTWQKAPVV